jgi:tRNA (guanine-N7-)-methyltransferase
MTMAELVEDVDSAMTETRPLRSYGRRKGKPLSARKERLLKDLLPRLRLGLAKPAPKALQALFPVPVQEVWLEIGFGSGEHLIWQAAQHKNVGLIGCEPFINGVAALLGAIDERGIEIIRVHDGDAREVLAWLPDGSVARIFILFPDPWPKKRQLKRRLISSDTIKDIVRVLVTGGELRFASDSADYTARVQFYMDKSGAFSRVAIGSSEWADRPPDWPETRYERKALSDERQPFYLIYRRL